MEEDFDNFHLNQEFGKFAKNCNKHANYIDLDPLRMKLSKRWRLQITDDKKNWHAKYDHLCDQFIGFSWSANLFLKQLNFKK